MHQIADVVGGAIASSSILFRLFPPPEKFNDWPRFQGWYKLGYTFLSWVALNK